ncbi:Carbon storage regulator [bioreactor metagenome]|uniref:Carbon storage regulator n=1 Tax=bioreactor metagenome TaxID=1076179 RepID=A0A644YH25_9ZZZZ
MIGDEITVSVISVDGDKVRLGIEAPRSIRVIRQELTAEVGLENRMAAQSAFFTLSLNKSESEG